MFSNTTGPASKARTNESRVFLPLEPGITPFPIKRSPVYVPPIFAKPRYELDDEQELPALLEVKSTPKLAAVAASIASVFRRQKFAHVSINTAKLEPTWFTSPENWRPGLVTLEQAASREDIMIARRCLSLRSSVLPIRHYDRTQLREGRSNLRCGSPASREDIGRRMEAFRRYEAVRKGKAGGLPEVPLFEIACLT
ncbi:hypothetical protein A7U60_g4858 [Sanghuangporus baumii]|uniref:Uncharacterized protein n=1 Tax=Sanghuangporus baumii TaxID=108892 RepID=A0A9Q5HY53_SANBA|nr:hypothetical protein A7U60_g4858 [Sanghuangporus baumii]